MLNFDPILQPLTPDQERSIQEVFRNKRRPKSEPDALVAAWFRLAEVAHQHALQSHIRPSLRALLLSPSVRNRRDRQLRQATKSARTAVRAITELVELVGKHSPGIVGDQGFADLQRRVVSVVAWLQVTERATDQYRLQSQRWPGVTNRRGTPRWLPETCLLEVLAGYFRKQGWPVAPSQVGLFAEVACAVLGNRASMNQARLRSLAKSKLGYDALEAAAPRDVQFAKPPIKRKNPRAVT